MESVYGQDCGGYNIEIYPSYPFFEFTNSGTRTDPRGQTYTDTGTFTSGTLDDIGQYEVTMVTF